MNDRSVRVASVVLPGFAIVCWVVVFLAGTDVWHDLGRADFWRLSNRRYADLRAFAYVFYLLFGFLSIQMVLATMAFIRRHAD